MENTFNLRDFFITICKKLKLVLILTFTLAILAGLYKANGLFKRKKDLDKQKNEIINSITDVGDSKENVYQNDLSIITNNISRLEKEIISMSEYRQNSVYYNLDAYNTVVSSLNVYVKSDTEENISDAYKNVLNSSQLYNEILSITNIEKKYITEILEVKKTADETTISSSSFSLYSSDYNSNFLTFFVYHNDEETARKIMDVIEKFLSDGVTNSALLPHELSVINKNTTTQFVEKVLANQNTQNTNYKVLKENMILENENLKGLKKPQNTNISLTYIVKQTAFFAVLGGAVGFVLAVILIFLWYLISDNVLIEKFLDENEIKNMGYLINNSKKTSKFDNYLLKLEGYNIKGLTPEKSALIIKSNLNYFLGEKKITLISSDEKINLEDVSKKLGSDYLDNAETNEELVKTIKDSKNLVLVESFKTASQSNLSSIINHVKKYDYKISGYILVK